jgi:hypothetical protein
MMNSSRKIRLLLTIGAVGTGVTIAIWSMADLPSELRPPEEFASIADPAERSAAMFAEAALVFTHPRCTNCHPDGDRPRQGDGSRLHEPFVRRGPDGHGALGLECSACHTRVNFDPAGVPGALNWHLAPREMAWHGKTAAEICQQLKDPARNGNRTLDEIHTHVSSDPLVTWGWSPGQGRVSAPGTQTIFAALIRGWIDDGAACPTPAP